jgi:hypothetical protein
MNSMQDCPFCSNQTETTDDEGDTRFKCSNCTTFLISDAVLKLFAKKQFLDQKPRLLADIKNAPSKTMPFVRRRSPEGEGSAMNEPYVQYLPR